MNYNFPDVIGNFTSLEVLDLSYNDLSDIMAPNIFILPSNLTFLSIAHNKLHTLPTKEIINATLLKTLDIRYNVIEHFYNDLMPMIYNGTNVLYEGKNFHSVFSLYVYLLFLPPSELISVLCLLHTFMLYVNSCIIKTHCVLPVH